MLAVGSEHTALLRMVKNGKLSIDMNMFLQNVVMADLNLTGKVHKDADEELSLLW